MSSPPPAPQTPPDRLKFAEYVMDRLPTGRCKARVVLSWQGEESFEGVCEGLISPEGELRCSAQACVSAITEAVEGKIKFDLLGVKAVRAFDATVVIVSLATHGADVRRRIVGSVLTEDDVSRAAALAVLNATNRLMGNLVFMR
jgi:hypothetical protein